MYKIIPFLLLSAVVLSCTTQEAESNLSDRSPQGQRKGPPNPADILKEMDANKDSKISKSEAKGPLLNDFAKIDADSDGYITLTEIEKMPKPEGRGPQNGQGGENAPRR